MEMFIATKDVRIIMVAKPAAGEKNLITPETQRLLGLS